MKKIILIITMFLFLTSCTQKTIATKFSNAYEITFPQGQKLIIITYENSSLWFLTTDIKNSEFNDKVIIHKVK
jgi:hypothetical protein